MIEIEKIKLYLKNIHNISVGDNVSDCVIRLIDELCCEVNRGNNGVVYNDFYYGTENGDKHKRIVEDFKKNLKANGFYDHNFSDRLK